MLISAPSDIPEEDLATIKKTISQWNLSMGRPSSVTVVPMSWTEHATAEFGERPQALLNHQLVDEADIALALFADRLGTPTGEADSGTLEEIERLVAANKPVGVLLNRGPRSLSGTAAVEEKQRLESAIEALYQRALVLSYQNQAELVGHLNNFLSSATGKVDSSGFAPRPVTSEDAIGVWPHAVREPYQESDGRGQLKSKTRYALEIRNETGRAVEDVRIEIGEAPGTRVPQAEETHKRLAPGGVWRRPVSMSLGGTRGFDCTVYWHYPGEPETSTTASVQF